MLFTLLGSLIAVEESSNRVYLASFPRSGNHWVRYIFEEVTNIVTTTAYHPEHDPYNPGHANNREPSSMSRGGYCYEGGYRGECREPYIDEMFLLKTHYPYVHATPDDLKEFKLTVRLVRHPVDSICSEYLKCYAKGRDKISIEDIRFLAQSWKKFQEYWDNQDNVYTIRYEDLLEDPVGNFAQLFVQLGYDVDLSVIEKALSVFPPINAPMKYLKYYDQETLDIISDELGDLMKQFDYKLF